MEYSTVQYRTRELLFESLAQLAVVSRRHVVRLSWLWTFRVCVLVVSRFLFFYVEMLLQQTYVYVCPRACRFQTCSSARRNK